MDVLPPAVPQGEAVELTLRVPSERPVATVEVEVTFPPQITVFSIGAPPAGWRVLIERGADGRLEGVRYTGGRIRPDRYADFPFLGTPFESGTAVFRTEQTYADGRVSRWTGPPGDGAAEPAAGASGPAAAIQIGAEGAAESEAGGGVSGGEEEGSGAAIWLGVIAIVIAAGAALLAGFLWSTRPARLPDDDGPEGA